MKGIIFAAVLLAMIALAGCEEPWEHGHRGGAYEDSNRGYGHGENRWNGYNDRNHTYYNNWNYPSATRPYQGYPDYDGYPHR